MDSLKRQNSPITPKTEKFNAEILHPPYKRGEEIEPALPETQDSVTTDDGRRFRWEVLP